MRKINADFNAVRRDGSIGFNPRAYSGIPRLGERVICVDWDEADLRYYGTIVEKDLKGNIYVMVDWEDESLFGPTYKSN